MKCGERCGRDALRIVWRPRAIGSRIPCTRRRECHPGALVRPPGWPGAEHAAGPKHAATEIRGRTLCHASTGRAGASRGPNPARSAQPQVTCQRAHHSTIVSGRRKMLNGKGSANPLVSWKKMPAAATAMPRASSRMVSDSLRLIIPRSLANASAARVAITPPRRPEVTAEMTICRYQAITRATRCTIESMIVGIQWWVSWGMTMARGGPNTLRKKNWVLCAMPMAKAVVLANWNLRVASTAR
mmetsp:Transcript_26691/g.89359  ORF Transcript_26691/g.89359 Transcript_26691/m.89359 type:complete len:243 (-) Transcript_26691:795-1523(-)